MSRRATNPRRPTANMVYSEDLEKRVNKFDQVQVSYDKIKGVVNEELIGKVWGVFDPQVPLMVMIRGQRRIFPLTWATLLPSIQRLRYRRVDGSFIGVPIEAVNFGTMTLIKWGLNFGTMRLDVDLAATHGSVKASSRADGGVA